MKRLRAACLARLDALVESGLASSDEVAWDRRFVTDSLAVAIRWGEEVYISTTGDVVTGYVTGVTRRRAMLRYLYVLPLHRGAGIGLRLTGEFCAVARANGATVVRAAASTLGAHAVFDHAGFVFTDRLDTGELAARLPLAAEEPSPVPAPDHVVAAWREAQQ